MMIKVRNSINYKSQKINMYDISLFLMLIACFALDDFQYVGIIFQSIFVVLMEMALLMKARHLDKWLVSYAVWLCVFIFFSLLSSTWASSLNKTAISSTLSVIQVGIISICLIAYMNKFSSVEKLIQGYILAAYIILIRFFVEVPISSLGNQSRFGNDSLFGKNETAVVLAITALFIVWHLMEYRSTKWKPFQLISVFLFLLVTMLMGTKGGLYVFFIGLVVLLVGKASNPYKLLATIVGILLSVIVLYSGIMKIRILYDSIGYRIEAMFYGLIGQSTDASTSMRMKFANYAIQVFKDHPIFGVGQDGFRYINCYEFTYSHNNYTEILANLGIMGFVIYYARYIKLISNSLRYHKIILLPLVLVIVLLCIDFTGVTYSLENEYFVMAIIIALLRLVEQNKSSTTEVD